jgi:transcriptional regulator with XRE-family HTH domain
MKIFAERLKKLRNDKELSQAKLANILGIAQQTIDRWEQTKTEPDMETIVRLATLFDVTADYLLGLSNDISKLEVKAKNSFNHNNGNIHINSKNKF